MTSRIRIPGNQVPILEAMADQVGRDPGDFIFESFQLGIELAEFALDAERPPARVLFEQPNGHFDAYPLLFTPQAGGPESLSLELREMQTMLFDQDDGWKIEIDDETFATMSDMATLLGGNVQSFCAESFAFRHLWGVTRNARGEIMIDDGSSDEDDYFVIEEDDFMI